MCGIAGIWNKDGAPCSEEALRSMVSCLGHRGPDAVGTWFARGLGLGHSRLKILDLSDAANQPFTDGVDALAFNGEVFNHRGLRNDLESRFEFRTHCDTEVLFRALQAWGVEALARLRGQFAFAFYRAADRTLLLARDHVGVCPLYVLETDKNLAFASEIRPLLTLTRPRLDPEGVKDYFAYRYNIQNGLTLFRDVKRFHPATYRLISLDSGRVDERRYWRLSFDTKGLSFDEAQESFNRIFEDEVAAQTMADVDVGMFLSGGIDSGALLTGFSKVTDNIRAFTLAFTDRDDDYEYVKAMESGRSFSSQLIYFPKDFPDHLEDVIRSLEEPFGDLIVCANYALAREAAKRVKVVLSGEGGDEAFCGYDHQRAFLKLEGMTRLGVARRALDLALGLAPPSLVGRMQSYPGDFGAAELDRIRKVVRKTGHPGDAYAQLVSLFDGEELERLFSPAFRSGCGSSADSRPIREIFDMEAQVWTAVMRAEIEQLTLIVNLLKQDRFCMAFSMEGRVPFVSRSVLEFAATLPYALINTKVNKKLIQGYSGGIRTVKKPFSMFASRDYLPTLARLMDKYADEDSVRDSGVLDWDAVQGLKARVAGGNVLAVKQAMAALIFLVWLKVFDPQRP